MAQVGKPLDQWQQLMVLDTFGLRDDGYWASFECVGLVPRQNGKGGYTEAVELGGLFLFKDQLIMHSAHLFKTAKQSFQRVVDIIDGSDWLTKRVHKVTRARGDEEIELTAKAGGGKLMYFSRSGGSGRGFTGDKTVFDECAYLTVEQYQAATPTLATVPNPQIVYTGTPPDEDIGPMPEDAMMPSVRKRGHDGGDRIALWEWSPPEVYDRTDPKVWAACNPSLGDRIQPWFLAKQLENFTAAGKPAKFDTEHLGLWPGFDAGPPTWQVVPEQSWLGARSEFGRLEPLALAVTLSDDRAWGCIAGAGPIGLDDAGRQLYGVSVIDRRPGTGWMTERLFDLDDLLKPVAVVINRNGPANSIWAEVENENLARSGSAERQQLELTAISPRDVAAAAGALYDGIAGVPAQDPETEVWADPKVVRHKDQEPLNAAMAAAIKRMVGPAGSFQFDPQQPYAEVAEGVANALFAYRSRPEPVPDPWLWDGIS